MFHLRKSKVLAKIREGKTAFSFKMNLVDPRVAEIAAMSGVDCIWIDMEHTPMNIMDVENIVRAAKLYDCDVLCRVQTKGAYSDYICPLEADSTAIMVPHVMSLDEAKKVVYYTKFAPIGRRPIDGGNADGKYCLVDPEDYIKEANEERFNVIQIEDPEPMAELEEICALPGIDMIFFGPADFSQGIGKTYRIYDDEVVAARRLVAKTAKKYGKMAGTVGSMANAKELVEEGYDFINLGADVISLANYFGSIMKECGEKFER